MASFPRGVHHGEVVPVTTKPGGKSEHRRAGWSVTPTGGDPRESATESRPPAVAKAMAGKGERVR